IPDVRAEDPREFRKRYEAIARGYTEADEMFTARAIVFNVKVNLSGQPDKAVTVPLFAGANRKDSGTGREYVSACNPVIARNIPVGQPLTMTFEVRSVSKKQFSSLFGEIFDGIVKLAGDIAPIAGPEFAAAGVAVGAVGKAGKNIAQ